MRAIRWQVPGIVFERCDPIVTQARGHTRTWMDLKQVADGTIVDGPSVVRGERR